MGQDLGHPEGHSGQACLNPRRPQSGVLVRVPGASSAPQRLGTAAPTPSLPCFPAPAAGAYLGPAGGRDGWPWGAAGAPSRLAPGLARLHLADRWRRAEWEMDAGGAQMALLRVTPASTKDAPGPAHLEGPRSLQPRVARR